MKHTVKILQSFTSTIPGGPLLLNGVISDIIVPDHVTKYEAGQLCEFTKKVSALRFVKHWGSDKAVLMEK